MIPVVLSRSLILMTTVWSVIGSFPVTHAVTDSFPTSHTNTDHTDCIEVLDARCSKVFCNLLCGYKSTHRVAITDCFTKSDNVRLHIWEQAKQHTLHTLVHGVWCVGWVQLLATHTQHSIIIITIISISLWSLDEYSLCHWVTKCAAWGTHMSKVAGL